MDNNTINLWERILKICKKSIDENRYNMFLKTLKVKDFSDNQLILICDSTFMKNGAIQYKKEIEEAADILLDEEIDVLFEVEKKEEPVISETYKIQEHKNIMKTGLNPKNTLDKFVIGDNSKLVFEACVAVVNAVSEDERLGYNPLFIYGSSGLGKTHLMQAVGNAILDRRPDKKVYYVTSEEYSNEYYKVLREHRIDEFRDSFRSLDVLLLDDIQFFEKVFGAGEGKVQEEFFHTFNKLQESGKQIIMISDRLPNEIKNLTERLSTRFIQGVSLEIQRPGYETRMAILQNFAESKNVIVEKNILEFIADSVNSNVRELEGILNTLIARSSLLNEKITLQQAQDELSSRMKNQRAKVTAEKIIDTVSIEYGIEITDMKSKKKQADIVNARQIAMYLLKDVLDLNLTTIGGLFGGRDHSTVISSLRKIEGKLEEEIYFKKEIERMKQRISQ